MIFLFSLLFFFVMAHSVRARILSRELKQPEHDPSERDFFFCINLGHNFHEGPTFVRASERARAVEKPGSRDDRRERAQSEKFLSLCTFTRCTEYIRFERITARAIPFKYAYLVHTIYNIGQVTWCICDVPSECTHITSTIGTYNVI